LPKKILLLSAYHAASHDYWLQGLLRELPDYHWTVLTLPPRHFNWRIRGNPLSWLAAKSETLAADYDLLIATSTVDLATLKGLVPRLAACPAALYFHENQFAYPQSQQAPQRRVEPQMVNLYSALAADELWFNSAYNRDSFIAGAQELMHALPDHVPDPQWIAALTTKSQVLPVPLQSIGALQSSESTRLRVVWNHRWEYDKGSGHLCRAIDLLCERGIEIELSLLGQRFRRSPAAMQDLVARLDDGGHTVKLVHNRFVADRDEYLHLLASQDVVLSTSLHDFQGLAVMEAVQAGCLPLVPSRLCYPEYFPADYLYSSRPEDLASEAAAVADTLELWSSVAGAKPLVPDLATLEWTVLRASYQRSIEALSR
jgi:glycosyltransferase involved in cell wall biosynthesis